MNKLEEYFKKDCSMMDKNRTPYDFYTMGYNRAQIEFLEQQLTDLKNQAGQWCVQHWLDETYNDIRGNYERNY